MPICDLSIKIIRFLADSYPAFCGFVYQELGNSVRKHFSALDEKADLKSILNAVKAFDDEALHHLYEKCNVLTNLNYQDFKQGFQSEIFCLICDELKIKLSVKQIKELLK